MMHTYTRAKDGLVGKRMGKIVNVRHVCTIWHGEEFAVRQVYEARQTRYDNNTNVWPFMAAFALGMVTGESLADIQ